MLACPASFFEERFPTSGNDNTIEAEFAMDNRGRRLIS
jgi:hypothetical protein